MVFKVWKLPLLLKSLIFSLVFLILCLFKYCVFQTRTSSLMSNFHPLSIFYFFLWLWLNISYSLNWTFSTWYWNTFKLLICSWISSTPTNSFVPVTMISLVRGFPEIHGWPWHSLDWNIVCEQNFHLTSGLHCENLAVKSGFPLQGFGQHLGAKSLGQPDIREKAPQPLPEEYNQSCLLSRNCSSYSVSSTNV